MFNFRKFRKNSLRQAVNLNDFPVRIICTWRPSLWSCCHLDDLVVHLVGTGDVDLVALVLVGQTSFVTTLVWSSPISGDKLYCEGMMKRRNGPSWLCCDDDDDDDGADCRDGRDRVFGENKKNDAKYIMVALYYTEGDYNDCVPINGSRLCYLTCWTTNL